MIAALVPVKRLDAAKSRLRETLPGDALPRLARAMLEDLLEALLAVPELDVVAVVTEDPEAARVAETQGAEALLLSDAGLNPSLTAGAERLAGRGLDALLVVLGDVAGATPADLGALLAAGRPLQSPWAVLAPSADGGTTALLRSPADAFPNAFGPDSAARHREAAQRAGVTLRELSLPSLRVDLDGAEDVDAFLASGTGGKRTRALLERLGWGEGRM
jgi:2-phospho-L-lactate guanylyltransferase